MVFLEMALQMIRESKKSGFDAVKFEKKINKLEKEVFKLSKKQFNVNWKATAIAHNRSIVNVDSVSVVSLNQLANKYDRQIKIASKKFKE